MPRKRYSRLNKLIKKKKWLLIILGLLLFLIATRGFRALVSNYSELRKIGIEKKKLLRENAKLRMDLTKTTEKEYIEQKARTELGLIKSGEVEYRFKKDDGNKTD